MRLPLRGGFDSPPPVTEWLRPICPAPDEVRAEPTDSGGEEPPTGQGTRLLFHEGVRFPALIFIGKLAKENS
jgi:hypothetical protein